MDTFQSSQPKVSAAQVDRALERWQQLSNYLWKQVGKGTLRDCFPDRSLPVDALDTLNLLVEAAYDAQEFVDEGPTIEALRAVSDYYLKAFGTYPQGFTTRVHVEGTPLQQPHERARRR